CARRTLAMDYW
nr:immunoglobulin heavy chain junction region [Mus musculus]